MSFCNGVTRGVNTGGTIDKLTFGKGTHVFILSGESSQVAPLATPWASVANPFSGDITYYHGEAC